MTLADRLRTEGPYVDPTWALRREAADELDRLTTEIAELRAELAGHRRDALIREVAHLPVQGPCRHGEFEDPHQFVRVPKSDQCSRCANCGWTIGK